MLAPSSDPPEHIAARERLKSVSGSGLSESYIAVMDIDDVYWLLGEYGRGNWPPRPPRFGL